MKRSRFGSSSDSLGPYVASSSGPDLSEVVKQFRNQLFQWLCLGSLTAAQVATIAYYASILGASGLSDLSVHPDSAAHNGSKKVKLVLGQEFSDPALHYVKDVPIYDRMTGQRAKAQIPIMRPSDIFAEQFSKHVDPEAS
jgi:hypothetical protein